MTKPTVLVIDDSALIRAQLKQLFNKMECQVVAEAASGDFLLSLYEQHRPTLVTLDIVMPGKDGLTALLELMQVHPEARVVMCTSLTTRDKILACQKAGVMQYLLKPFDPVRAEQIFRFALAQPRKPDAPEAARATRP
jgi:two-component system chemotaxis response regulator CheY